MLSKIEIYTDGSCLGNPGPGGYGAVSYTHLDVYKRQVDTPLNRKIISLCGHIHSKDKWCDFDKGLVYHVELDAHNCFPISIDAIMADIQQKLEYYNLNSVSLLNI